MFTAKQVVFASVGAGVLAVTLAGWTNRSAARADTPRAGNEGHTRILNAYASLPLAFVENRGQADPRVRFYAQGSRYAFHFTRDSAVLSFVADSSASQGVVLGLRFVGGNPHVAVEGEQRAPGELNYLRGSDPSLLADRAPPVLAPDLPRAVARRRHDAGRTGRSAEVRVPGEAGGTGVEHPPRLLWRKRNCPGRQRRADDPDGARGDERRAAARLPGDRGGTRAGGEPLRADAIRGWGDSSTGSSSAPVTIPRTS